MRMRGLSVLQLVGLLAMLAIGCTPRSEDTGCPAMERALDEAYRNGVFETLPHGAEDSRYKVVLERRTIDGNCDVSYRFRISGLSASEFESDAFDQLICRPEPITSVGISMDDGDVIMDAQVSQWVPTREMKLVVGGGQFCNGLPLTFTHVGRIAQP